MLRRRFLPLLVVVALVSVFVAGVGSTSAQAFTRGGGAPSAVTCGGSTTLQVGTRKWTCAFDDEFSSGRLDSTKWSPQTTAGSGWTTADSCYVNSPSTISVSGGALHLVARQLSTPMSCGGAYDTVHTGGALVSYGHFSQTYGRFEIRARFPATTEAGFWGNLWLYPNTLSYGGWPSSGEVDMAEHWSGHGDSVFSSLHYSGSSGADSKGCTATTVSQFHTYATEWTTTSMSFFIDGQLCLTRDWTATTGSTSPFDRPFFLVLSEGYGDFNLPISSALPQSGPLDVDYVRVYR